MAVSDIKIGLQLHSVRESFQEDEVAALRQIKEMGYSGVEFVYGTLPADQGGLLRHTAEYYREAMKKTDMECYGVLVAWENLQPDKLQHTIGYCRTLGSPSVIIGSVTPDHISTIKEVREAISYMNQINEVCKGNHMISGYHNHASDFTHVVDGKTFFEHVFDNTPEDFMMVLDTGNAMDGGFDSIELLKKYPERSQILHMKGYSQEKKYLAYIGQDDFNWEALTHCAVETGKAQILNVEFGLRGDYDPFERARSSYDVLRHILDE